MLIAITGIVTSQIFSESFDLFAESHAGWREYFSIDGFSEGVYWYWIGVFVEVEDAVSALYDELILFKDFTVIFCFVYFYEGIYDFFYGFYSRWLSSSWFVVADNAGWEMEMSSYFCLWDIEGVSSFSYCFSGFWAEGDFSCDFFCKYVFYVHRDHSLFLLWVYIFVNVLFMSMYISSIG